MKKKITALLAVFLVLTALGSSALAAEGGTYIRDPGGILTAEECAALESRAADIAARSGCGVYAALTDDGGSDIFASAAKLYHDGGFGEGAGRDGVLLLVDTAARGYAVFVYGEGAEAIFDAQGQSALEDSFLPAFGGDDWCGGIDAYLSACGAQLAQEEAGESPVGAILTAVGGSCAVAMVICLALKGRMKSVRRREEAGRYAAFGGFELTASEDRFTHTTESRRRIEKKESRSESGGGGSGRSGKF